MQNLTSLRKATRKRVVTRTNSRGAKLQTLEDTISTLDARQFRAVIQTVDEVQRIRGLAGSGKTVVLALKAAYLHIANPTWRIAVTFNVRALKDQFIKLITDFCIAEIGELPDWEYIKVIPSWGSLRMNDTGVYAEFCKANDLGYLDYRTASAMFGGQDAFSGACAQALHESKGRELAQVFDAILVDEAQDFSYHFLQLCYKMLGAKKRLVFAYDELQNLSSKGMPSVEEIFGRDESGRPLVSFEGSTEEGQTRDILLQCCYRNSRPVLSAAHAFGFGIYRPPQQDTGTGLVQMFDQASLWEDIGYRVRSGLLVSGEEVVLERTPKSSPLFLEEHSERDDLMSVNNFPNMEAQYEWVADEIERNLRQDELRYNDIMIINPDPISARKNLGPLRVLLQDRGIATHIAGVDTSSDVFFAKDSESITCTGIYRAKGNEAGMVYVVNAHEGQSNTYNLALVRNRLFTAITRSKAWVRLTGFGPEMKGLVDEFSKMRLEDFRLEFVYPTDAQRAKLRIVHRELTPGQERVVKSSDKKARELLTTLMDGAVHPEDLDRDVREALMRLLGESDA